MCLCNCSPWKADNFAIFDRWFVRITKILGVKMIKRLRKGSHHWVIMWLIVGVVKYQLCTTSFQLDKDGLFDSSLWPFVFSSTYKMMKHKDWESQQVEEKKMLKNVKILCKTMKNVFNLCWCIHLAKLQGLDDLQNSFECVIRVSKASCENACF